VARTLDRVRERAHDVLRCSSSAGPGVGPGKEEVRRVRDVLCERAPSHCQLRTIDDVRVREEVLEQCGDSTYAMQIRHVVPPGRLEIGEVRRAVCHGLEVVDREVDIRRAGHGWEVQDLRHGGQAESAVSVYACAGGGVRTAFVEPPRMLTIAMAFRNEFRVRMSLCGSSIHCRVYYTGLKTGRTVA
jgi:hypothetical protein